MSTGRYDCIHWPKCDGTVTRLPDDPLLPDHIRSYECDTCGEVTLLDVETGEMKIDG